MLIKMIVWEYSWTYMHSWIILGILDIPIKKDIGLYLSDKEGY